MLLNLHLNSNGSTKSGSGKKDLIFVPVTINYDRVVEGEIFPLDLLGETVRPPNIIETFKKLAFVKKEQGKVVLRYCEPVSLAEYKVRYQNKFPAKTISNNNSDFIRYMRDELSYQQVEN